MKAGDRIKVPYYIHDKIVDYEEHTVEEFRYCLGIFLSEDHRKAEDFTPLCNIYYDGPESEDGYISNYGHYRTNQVPSWIDLPRIDEV